MKKSAILIAVIFIGIATSLTISLQASAQNYNIPNWIKNNAKWWSEGTIGDSDFISGIKYLIENEIMIIDKEVETSTSDISASEDELYCEGVTMNHPSSWQKTDISIGEVYAVAFVSPKDRKSVV